MSDNITARIFKIERLNNHNGPGFRTVIFFKGCPLHCNWCHNPEGISKKKQVWHIPRKCIGCGLCGEVCPQNALELNETGIRIDHDICNGCFGCVEVCPSEAVENLGEDFTVDDLMGIILKDELIFNKSGGGVTVTGGEPGLYTDFVAELFRQCKQHGIQTAFDTSGSLPLIIFDGVLKHTDLLFLDIKVMDPYKSLAYTGLDVKILKTSLNWLREYIRINPDSIRISIRTPLVPGITDTKDNLMEIALLIKGIGEDIFHEWELCLFNDFCEEKYIKLDLPWVYTNMKNDDFTQDIYNVLRSNFNNLDVSVTGLETNQKQIH